MTSTSPPLPTAAAQVLETWFGPLDTLGMANEEHRQRWYKKDASFDRLLGDSFGSLVGEAVRGEHEDWYDSDHAAVALIILLDQMTRNIHRGTAEMFSGDARAARLSLGLVDDQRDKGLPFHMRTFVYMPLMHAESVPLQQRCVACFETLAESYSDHPAAHGGAQYQLDFAIRHLRIVERFGRFPHRNEMLGRESTPEELEFLNTPGSSF